MGVMKSLKLPRAPERPCLRAQAVASSSVRKPDIDIKRPRTQDLVTVPVSITPRDANTSNFVSASQYDSGCVGPKAMELHAVGWTIPPSAAAERSISWSKGAMLKILTEHYENAAAARHVQAVMDLKHKMGCPRERHLGTELQEAVSKARESLWKLHIPQQIRDELLEAFVAARMPVPLVVEEWEALRKEIGAAFVALLSIIVFQNTNRTQESFGHNSSILFRDRSKRAYTFSATTDCSRRVYINIGIPHCEGQGMGAVCGRGALGQPMTVHHPQRACAVDGETRLVVLDIPEEMSIPKQIGMHHREGDSGPSVSRTSFEGDNMLLVPHFRKALFCKIATLALAIMEQRAWEGMADARVSVPEAAEIRGFVNPDLGLVVSSIKSAKIDITSKPWTLESRF